MLCMTRHKHAQTGLVTPSLPQLWLTAMLRVLAMLVSSVCSTLQMTRRPDRVNATRATPADLPRAKTDIQQQETHEAAQHRSPLALILRDSEAIVSKDEGVLITVSFTRRLSSAKRAAQKSCVAGTHCNSTTAYEWFPALRFFAAGMTSIAAIENAQPARSHQPAPPSLRSSRRKSGPRASRAVSATGLRQQPWIPACAGTSGTRPATHAPN